MSFFHVRSSLTPTRVSILLEWPFLYLLFGWRTSFHSFGCLHHSKQFIKSEICETLYIGRKTDDISIRPSDQVEEPSFNTAWWSHIIYILRILTQLQKRKFVGNRYLQAIPDKEANCVRSSRQQAEMDITVTGSAFHFEYSGHLNRGLWIPMSSCTRSLDIALPSITTRKRIVPWSSL